MPGGLTLNLQILRLIECFCCKKFMEPPIHLCYEGHSFCDHCFRSNIRCTQCYAKFSMVRSMALEAIAIIVPRPCMFQVNGCTEYWKLDDIEDHENICGYYKFKCEVLKESACEWVGLYLNFRNHAEFEHGDILQVQHSVEGRSYVWNENMRADEVMIFQAHDEFFFLYRHSTSEITFWAMQFAGEYKGSWRYHYQLKILNDESGKFITFSGLCPDILLIETEVFVEVPKHKINEFKNKKGDVNYEVLILKI